MGSFHVCIPHDQTTSRTCPRRSPQGRERLQVEWEGHDLSIPGGYVARTLNIIRPELQRLTANKYLSRSTLELLETLATTCRELGEWDDDWDIPPPGTWRVESQTLRAALTETANWYSEPPLDLCDVFGIWWGDWPGTAELRALADELELHSSCAKTLCIGLYDRSWWGSSS